MLRILLPLAVVVSLVQTLRAADLPPISRQPANTWIKRSPLPDGPVSPRLGYEGACVWDSQHQLVIRYGGHNQGGGGEQGAEVWTFDPHTAKWMLKEPNTSPPGVCCNAQNVYDPTIGRYIRFPKFSGSHGWQWWREIYLNDSSVWTYDLAKNRWKNMRPLPTPRLAPYRAASWDSHQRVVVVFGGEGSHEGTLIYDPWRNEWRWPRPATEPAPRSGGNMAYDAARKLHVLFGSQFTDDPHTWTYDVAANQWQDMMPNDVHVAGPDGTRAQLPAWMTEPRWGKVALVVDPHFKLTTLRTLRKLLDSWLGSQVFATTPGESREKEDACPAVGSFVNNIVNADECTQSGDLRSDGIAPATFADSAPGVTPDAPSGPNKGDIG